MKGCCKIVLAFQMLCNHLFAEGAAYFPWLCEAARGYCVAQRLAVLGCSIHGPDTLPAWLLWGCCSAVSGFVFFSSAIDFIGDLEHFFLYSFVSVYPQFSTERG